MDRGAWMRRGADGRWAKRVGRPADGELTEFQARRLMRQFVVDMESQLASKRSQAVAASPRVKPTFRELAHARPLGNLPAAEITREHIDALLTVLDKQPISRRTVNKHRAILHAIFSFSRSPDQRARWGVVENPVTDTRTRREEDPGHLEVFTVEQIEALASAAESGIWRSERAYVAVIRSTSATRRTANWRSFSASPRIRASVSANL